MNLLREKLIKLQEKERQEAKQKHIKEIQDAAAEWERQQLMNEERILSIEKTYRELIYFYNENTSRKYS